MTTRILFYLFMMFHQLGVVVSADNSTLPSYRPPEDIAILCGLSGSHKALNDRIWEGDITSKFFTLQGPNNASIASSALHPPTLESDTTLYKTARLSRSEIKYTIPVTAGPKFIRLHFYPVVYGDFDTSKAFFSVKAAHYTLLRNFSASLTAAALRREDVVKEYLINVEESNAPNITLTFAPFSSNSDSFAFINGIEVVSMPTNLYYSAADNEGAKFVGQSQGLYYPIQNDTAMEMLYRINVGGADVVPDGDTGMYRNWDRDDEYITIFGYSVAPFLYKNDISYNKAPAYTAPRVVYTTARSMGNITNETLLQSYNLTWEFPVDSRFYFLFRLHFCEIQAEMKSPGDRVFYIFIANETAENQADVISWSGQQYVPVYQDYVISTNGIGDQDKINMPTN